jgi:YegS/Rv2252/BmrU family lipid kinase
MKVGKLKVHLIYNPTAGPWDARNALKRVCAELGRRGWSVELRNTGKAGDAAVMAREAAQAGCDAVIIAGGDGTLNEAVNGLVGTQTALGVLPVGTGNRWARQLRIPHFMIFNPLLVQETATALTNATIRLIDIGQANQRFFLCWAGIGLDAQVTAEIEPRPKYTKHWGTLAYIIAAFRVAREFRGVPTRVEVDGKATRSRTLLVLASNIQEYAGGLHIINQARVDDGLLDICVCKGLGFSYALRHAFTMLSRRSFQDPKIVHRQACSITVQTENPVALQVDGDPVDTTPVTIRVVPRALRVLVPHSAPAILFTNPE